MAVRHVIAIMVAGCLLTAGLGAAKPFAPKGAILGPDYAELTFELGLDDTVSMGSAKTQEYRISPSDRFDDGKTVKMFTWAAKKPKTILLPAGKQTHVFARMTRLFGAPGITSWGNNWCVNGASFTPQAGTRYRVMQKGSPYGACTLSIMLADSGQQAPGQEPVLFNRPNS